jgi:8-oxoguanine deaminase
MTIWIKNPLAVWTGNKLSDNNDNNDAAGGIVIDGDTISELIPKGGSPRSQIDSTLDAGDCVLLPGLINCHHHFYQTLTRAFPSALNKELFDWLVSLYPVWANLTEEAISVSTEVALTELLLSGCTTAADHHYVFSDETSRAIDCQVEAAEKTGMRVLLTRGSMSLGQDQGGLPPNSVVQSADVILKDSERLIEAYHDGSRGSMVQIALAPCSPFSVTTELMRDSGTLAREHNVRLHTHLAETEDENKFCLDMFGLRPLDYLESVGWLADDVWLAHGIHFTETEIDRLGQAGTAICHCPGSNMMLASGLCPVSDLEKAGCPVGLGVDGSASNDSSNLIQEVRQAFLLQRLKYGSANISHEDSLRLATTGGARLMGRTDIGEIAVGKQADVALFNLDEPRFAGAGDPIAALVLCGAHKAEHVMVKGQWRVTDGHLVAGDLDSLLAKQQQIAANLAAKDYPADQSRP